LSGYCRDERELRRQVFLVGIFEVTQTLNEWMNEMEWNEMIITTSTNNFQSCKNIIQSFIYFVTNIYECSWID
jgi:hypothetical protein